MSSQVLKQSILEQLNAIIALVDKKDVLQVANAYSILFLDLFGSSNKTGALVDLLKTEPNAENINFYLKTLSQLKKEIESLPLEDRTKSAMLGKMAEYCNFRILAKFEQQGHLSAKEHQQIIASLHSSLIDTIQVKTWGTRQQIGNGLHNIVMQKMRGEANGHAAMIMRLKVDERGQQLINKYCHNEHGGIKIPYEIKNYGSDAVYEVYWSFWPKRLEKPEWDMQKGQSQAEHADDLDILREMPLELKSRYLLPKFTQERQLPVLGNFGAERAAFVSEHAGSRKIGLSVAQFDASKIEPDLFRRNFMELKAQQYKLEEEIHALSVLKDNYLSTDKPFDAQAMNGDTPIKAISNFLVLLKRFCHQFKDPSIAAQVLLHQRISVEQAEALNKQVNDLLAKKEAQKEDLADPIKQAANLIQENYTQISLLKERIREVEETLNTHNKKLELINATLSMLKEARNSGTEHVLTEQEKELLAKVKDEVKNVKVKDEVKNVKVIIDVVNQTEKSSVFTARQIGTLNTKLTGLSELPKKDMRSTYEDLNKAQSSLAAIYQKQADNQLEFLKQKLTPIDLALKQNADNFARFQLLKQTLTPWLELNEQLFAAKDSLAELKKIADSGSAQRALKTHIADLKQQLDSYAANINAYQKTPSAGYCFASEVNEKKSFSRINSRKGLDDIEANLNQSRSNLERQKKEIETQIIRSKFGALADELDLRIHRSPSNDVVLRNFDVEKMLKKASKLATTHGSFSLAEENCSTTTMRILKAGAPADTAALFQCSKAGDDEQVASNAFLTNPQTIYSVAKTVEMAEKGDLAAQRRIHEAKTAKPELEYNRLLNELSKLVVNESPEIQSFRFIARVVLKFIPHLLKLYRDLFQITKLPQEEESTSLEAQLARELKSLQGKDYHLIDSTNPVLALHRFCEALKENKTNIPFLTTDTLSRVEQYILAIQANVPQTKDDQALVQRYQGLIAERDARIQCVENTIIAGESAQENLEKRAPELASLQWMMTEQEKTPALVDNFIYNYQKIRSRNPLSFLTSNFINRLDACSTVDMKLREIKKHVLAYPNSRSGEALAKCLVEDKVLRTVYIDAPVERNAFSFFKAEPKDKRQEPDSSYVYGM